MPGLQLSSTSMNYYEEAHDRLSQAFEQEGLPFDEGKWLDILRGNVQANGERVSIDDYIYTLDKASEKGVTTTSLESIYETKYASSDSIYDALVNEVFADRTNVNANRKRYVFNSDGSLKYDDNHQLVVEDYTASDYDYYRDIIKYNNKIHRDELAEQDRVRKKEELGKFVQYLASIPGAAADFTAGLANNLDELTMLFGAVDAGVKSDNFSKGFVEYTGDYEGWSTEFQQDLVAWEAEYTNLRNLDGTYTDYGKVFGGVMTSLGEMAPAMLVSYASGGIGGAILKAGTKASGIAAKAASAASKVVRIAGAGTSQSLFYGAMTAATVQDTYKNQVASGVSVAADKTLSNALIKSAAQWAIERAMGSIFGNTTMDRLLFGRTAKSVSANSLTAAGVKRLAKDFVQEGSEEVLQDLSDVFVDRLYTDYVNETFDPGQLDSQTLVDSFVIGGLASLVTSSASILTTRRVSTDTVAVRRYGNTKGDVKQHSVGKYKGVPVANKLSKFASWEYGIDLQAFTSAYSDVSHIGKWYQTKAYQNRTAKNAFKTMYAAARMMASIYSEVGQDRFNKASVMLSNFQKSIDKRTSVTEIQSKAIDIKEVLDKTVNDAKVRLDKSTLNYILSKDINNVKEVYNKSEYKELGAELKKTFDSIPDATKIVVTEKGTSAAKVGNVIILPEGRTQATSAKNVVAEINEQTLIENILNCTITGPNMDILRSIYSSLYGNDVDDVTILTSLLFSPEYFEVVLFNADKDMYKFLYSITNYANSLKTDNIANVELKEKISKSVESWKPILLDFCVNHKDAEIPDVLSDKERNIMARRWCKGLYNRVILGEKLSKQEKDLLTERIKAAPTSESIRSQLYKVFSPISTERKVAMDRLNSLYDNAFNTNYNGVVYMPDNSIANNTFNAFLKSHGLTLQTFSDDSMLTDSDRTLMKELEIVSAEAYHSYLFSKWCGNFWYLTINSNHFSVVMTSDGKLYGYDSFNELTDKISDSMDKFNVDSEEIAYELRTNSDVISSLVSDKIDNVTKAGLTINDILTNPDLLNDKIKAVIASKYSVVNTYTAFSYLKSYVNLKNHNLSILIKRNGSFTFGTIYKAKDILVSDKVKITESSKITDIIKRKFLVGPLKSLNLKFMSDEEFDDGIAMYSEFANIPTPNGKTVLIYDNTIYLRKDAPEAELMFDFIHEFTHAVQFAYGLNSGIQLSLTQDVSNTVRKEIIADTRWYLPELFDGIAEGSLDEIILVEDIIYTASGELGAFGVESKTILLPFILNTTMNHNTLVVPWGKAYPVTYSNAAISNRFGKYSDLENNDDISQEDMYRLANFKSLVNVSDNLFRTKEIVTENEKFVLESYDSNPKLKQEFEILEKMQEYKKTTQDTLDSDSSVSPEYRQQSLKVAYHRINTDPNVSFEQFLQKDYPYIMYRDDDAAIDKNSKYIGVFYGAVSPYIVAQLLDNNVDVNNDLASGHIVVGHCKPIDVVVFAKGQNISQNETFVTPNVLNNGKIFKLKRANTNYEIEIPDGSTVYSNIPNTSLTMNKPYVLLKNPKQNKPKGTVEVAKDKEVLEKTKYKYYKYDWYIRDDIRMNSNLKYYKLKYIDPDTQHFIVNASKDTIDAPLWKQITQGTLTKRTVIDYLRQNNEMSKSTFDLINESFFKNTAIKSIDELNNLVAQSPRMYAIRVMLRNKELGLGDNFGADIDQNRAMTIEQLIVRKESLAKEYAKLWQMYEDSDVPAGPLRVRWMSHYDGSILSAGRAVAGIKVAVDNGWKVVGAIDSRLSLQDSKSNKNGEAGLTYAEIITKNDDDASEYFSELNDPIYDTREKLLLLLEYLSKKQVAEELIRSKTDVANLTPEELKEKYKEKETAILKLLNDIVDSKSADDYHILSKQLDQALAKLDFDKIDKWYAQLKFAENTGDYDIIGTEVDVRLIRRPQNLVTSIKRVSITIKKNLSEKQKALFLKENGDIYNDDLTVKKSAYMNESETMANTWYNKSIEELEILQKRILELSKMVRAGYFNSKQLVNIMKRHKKNMDRSLKELTDKVNNVTNKTYITYTVDETPITLSTSRPIPSALKKLLDHHFNEVASTKVKFVADDDAKHIKTQLYSFIEENAQQLAELTQADADEIIEFYSAGFLDKQVNNISDFRKFYSIQMAVISYILQQYKTVGDARFSLTSEQVEQCEKILTYMSSFAGQILSNWNSAKALLKPEEIIQKSLLRKFGLDYEGMDKDVQRLCVATGLRRMDDIVAARQVIYNNALKVRMKKKRNVFDLILQYERMAMLSGPGTWIRNQASNIVISGLNIAAEQTGKAASSLIMKLFPEKKRVIRQKTLADQYKIVGTVVSESTRAWIQDNVLTKHKYTVNEYDAKTNSTKEKTIEVNLYDLIADGLNRYDSHNTKTKQHTEDGTNLGELIAEAVVTKVSTTTGVKFASLNNLYSFLYKMMSDNPFIKKSFVRYLGKMLQEDVDRKQINSEGKLYSPYEKLLEAGLGKPIINIIAEAYTAATTDYMHKGNLVSDMERQIRFKGDKAYFAYKQVFPFMSTSVNWWLEGLNYTPLGLLKAIYDFVKLEDVISNIEDKRMKGDKTISPRLANYMVTRRIGKGVIGTIGFAVGMVLALTGVVQIDDEDDKWKIKVGDSVYLDVSGLFGTQGILLGMALFGSAKSNPDDAMDILASTLEQMSTDCGIDNFINTFRWNSNFGEYLSQFPYTMMSMFIPNFIKTLSMFNLYKVDYEPGFVGYLQRLSVQIVPQVSYAYPTVIDPYTGEKQIAFAGGIGTNMWNKLFPIDLYPYRMSDAEKDAILYGVHSGTLTGNYTINDKKVKLTTKQIQQLNEYYGQLNKTALTALLNDEMAYSVKNEKTGDFQDLKYSKMTDKQKAAALKGITSKNSSYAKIYVLTNNGYKYYTTKSELDKLRKLKIANRNTLEKDDHNEGFVV